MSPALPARSRHRLLAVAPALALLLLVVSPARADDWQDALTEFRAGARSPDWKVRRDAFISLESFDRRESVEEVLSVLAREGNDAVVLAGVEALGAFRSTGSREVLMRVVRKGRGRERLLVLLALQAQAGPDVAGLMLELAGGRDGPTAAHAAKALGVLEPDGALPMLIELLGNKDWQVRGAAARSLGSLGDKSAVPPLASALKVAKGRDRKDMVDALENLTGQKYGYDPAAWRKLAKGVAPSEIRAKPRPMPMAFGIPIYGQRVVICLDNSQRMTDPHPFDADRLRELTEVEHGRPISWIRMKTNGQFAHGHVKHLIQGLDKGTRFELIVFNQVVRDVLGGLKGVGSGTRKLALDTIDGLTTAYGINAYGALTGALDIVSPKEAISWKSGPDEILYVTVNQPTVGEIKDANVVAAAIGLKARLRMVPIHMVGIHTHAYDMHRVIAEQSGGIYVDLHE